MVKACACGKMLVLHEASLKHPVTVQRQLLLGCIQNCKQCEATIQF